MKLPQATPLRSNRSAIYPVTMRPSTAANVVLLTAQPAVTGPVVGPRNANGWGKRPTCAVNPSANGTEIEMKAVLLSTVLRRKPDGSPGDAMMDLQQQQAPPPDHAHQPASGGARIPL